MKISRNFTNVLNFLIDQLLPPIIRDSRLLAYCMLFPVVGRKVKYFLNFRMRAYEMSNEEYVDYYAQTAGILGRDTDLGHRSFKYLVQNINARKVLEVGAGTGLLARELSRANDVTAVDILIPDGARNATTSVTWHQAEAECLPFTDKSFDIVVCAHTLEHTRDFATSISELRRVAREKIFIVVPLQRPYRYSPDLHIWYFPYPHSFIFMAQPRPGTYVYQILDKDLVYQESVADTCVVSSADSEESLE